MHVIDSIDLGDIGSGFKSTALGPHLRRPYRLSTGSPPNPTRINGLMRSRSSASSSASKSPVAMMMDPEVTEMGMVRHLSADLDNQDHQGVLHPAPAVDRTSCAFETGTPSRGCQSEPGRSTPKSKELIIAHPDHPTPLEQSLLPACSRVLAARRARRPTLHRSA